MSRPSKEDVKRARERAHLEAFKSAYTGFPAGIIEVAEQPDFTVALGPAQKLGIEHTEFFRDDGERGGSGLRLQESLQDKTLWKAREAYERKGLPAVDVRLYWAPYDDIARERVAGLAEEITKAVAAAAQTCEEGSVEIENTGLSDSPVPDEVNLLRIARFQGLTRNVWNTSRADYEPGIARNEIEHILNRKGKKLAKYRRACSQVWLLIVAEGLAPSSYGDVEALREERFVSSFDEVFFFRFFDGDVLRLTTFRP